MIGDQAVKAKTGKDWKQWFALLDRAGAKKLDHRGIVAIVGRLGAGPWWQQMITVSYEQQRGLREKHQKTGGFSASASKTVATPVAKLYQALEAWLSAENGVEIRKATPGRSLRFTWCDGTDVTLNFYAKGDAKSQVTVEHEKLAAAPDVARMKKYWGAVLGRLA